MFHQRRVVEALRDGWAGSATHTLAQLLQAVDRFAASMDQADDISALILRRAKNSTQKWPMGEVVVAMSRGRE
jgi:hypothetical protein